MLGTPAALAVAPGFSQRSYALGRIPVLFMFTRSAGGTLVPKTAPAAASAAAAGPREGYLQFDQPGVSHGFLIDPTTLAIRQLAQRQMAYYVRDGLVVDPTVTSAELPGLPAAAGTGVRWRITPPETMKIPGR